MSSKTLMQYPVDYKSEIVGKTKLEILVHGMKKKEKESNKKHNIAKINNEETLTGKCIMARLLLSPQSTVMESIIRNDLNIEGPENETSGDGHKDGVNYEIKVSLHAKGGKINFVQIRPDHNIGAYILMSYNMYENEKIGMAHIFNVPADKLYKLVADYGGYAHGTLSKLGKITSENIKGRGCEYALRCNPNKGKGKNFELWQELLKHQVSYDAENF